jgi:hypothetical protein
LLQCRYILPTSYWFGIQIFHPSVPSSVFVPKLRWYLNLPHKFSPTFNSNSVESIFIRLIIGCVKPLVTPGICSLLFISSMISLLVLPALHSLWGLAK